MNYLFWRNEGDFKPDDHKAFGANADRSADKNFTGSDGAMVARRDQTGTTKVCSVVPA